MKYTSANAVMLEHRYPGSTETYGQYDLVGDAVVREMFGAVRRGSSYGTLPVGAEGAVQLQPVVAAGVDTGTVQLASLAPQPSLTPGAEDGVEMGFAEFMREYGIRG